MPKQITMTQQSSKQTDQLPQALAEIQANKNAFSNKVYEYISSSLMQQEQKPQTPEPTGTKRSDAYLDVIQFLRIILSNLWLILIVGVAGSVIVYFVVDAQTSIYETYTTLAVMPTLDESAIPRPIEKIDIALGTYVQVLRSQNLKAKVEETLQGNYTAKALLKVETDVRSVENSSIITVKVRSANPELAQAYAAEIARQMTDENPLPQFALSYSVGILDLPILPEKPVYPDKKVSLVLGILGSSAIGVLLAFLWDTYVKSRQVTIVQQTQQDHTLD